MAKPKSRKPPRPAKAPELPAQLKPYVGKHPADLILEHYETQARKLLKAEGLPVDLAELMQWHDPPKDRKQREQWLKNFEEHHLRYFPEDRGKILKPRQAGLRGVLFQAERTREAIAAGDPQAAAAHSHRLAVEAVRADIALYGEKQSKSGSADKKKRGIRYAIEEELTGPGRKFETPRELWQHFEAAHRDIPYSEKARYPHGAEHDPGKIAIEHPDFFGEVYFDSDEARLYQEPDPKRNEGRQAVSVSKKTGIRFKTFENTFNKVKKALL
jgi:hypothetical protein